MKSCYRFFLLFSITLLSCAPNAKIQYFVKNGLIDLSNYDFNKSGTITLNGFYYYKYNCFDLAINNKDMKLFRIPGYWNQKEKSGTGFALLKVNLILPDKHNLFIYQDYCSTAYELYANNSLILKGGKWGIDKKSSIPQLKSDIAQLPNSKNIELTYRISNFHSDVGGIPFSPIIGIEAQIKDIIFKRFFYDAALFGILLILGIYHFFLWIWHKKDRAALYLALSSIAIAIRILTANFFISWLFPEPSVLLYEIQLKITYFFGCFGWFIIPFFINALYEFSLNKKLLLIIKFLLISFFVFLLFSPVSLFNSWLIPFQIIIVIIGLWNMISLSVAIYQKKPNASFILIGFIFFFITTINDLLYAHNIINTYNIISFGLVILIFTQAIALAKNFSNAFKQSEYLSLHLKDEVQSRTRQLEEVTRQKTDFFINLAHETKTPLTLIQNYLDKYLKKHQPDQELLMIKSNIDKLTQDMVNFLDAEKIEQEKISYSETELIDLSELTRQKVLIFQALADKKQITLQSKITSGINIIADPYAMARVINNLIDNAIRYTREQGIVTVILENRDNMRIAFIVEDNGIGIPREQQHYIFNKYYQISQYKKNTQGIGMGLYITKNIVQALKGTISFKSEEGRGSVFEVILTAPSLEDMKRYKPCRLTALSVQADIPVISIAQDLTPLPYDPAKFSILIIEDNMDLLLSLKQELEKKYNISTALNGKDALSVIAKQQTFDLVISDIMMDEMDGFAFYNEFMNNEHHKQIPFIFLTAKTMVKDKLKGLEMGAVDYIYKPFYMDELVKKVKAHLQIITARKMILNIEKYAVLGKQIAGIAHQIRNPLTFMLSPLDSLTKNLKVVPGNEKNIKLVESIEDGITRIQKLVKDLLNVSYNSSSDTSINLLEVVNSVMALIPRDKKEHITFNVEIDEDFYIRGNANNLIHIFMNLINNAVDAINDTGIISIKHRQVEKDLFIDIIDNGKGIDEKDLPAIYNMDFTTKEIGSGTGMGLYIVKDLIERMKWEIAVKSQMGKGTTFTLIKREF